MSLLIGTIIVLHSCSTDKIYDVCIYGGTSSAVVAAYSSALQDMDVVLVSPDSRLGGMTSGGLGYTDIGNKQVVSGIARQFYRQVGKVYGRLEQWIFEPSVAERIFENYASNQRIKLYRPYYLDRVNKKGNRISSLKFVSKDDPLTIRARFYIDCTYEGDLMAKSGVSYVVGRESNAQYSETYDGVQMMSGHQFPDGIDPYVREGHPESGLLWGISEGKELPNGTPDSLVQAYNFRICLTDSAENMIPISKPADYDPSRYELLLRLIKAQKDKRALNDYFIWTKMPNRKTDINNRGGFSTDMIGMNYAYPNADYAERQRIIATHRNYTQGLLYFIGHDERVPEEMREEMLRWGYPKDEFVESGNWTPQLYVRESRRMVGEYVITQQDCEGKRNVEDGVGLAAYNMDSHNCRRIVVHKDGRDMVKNEGNVEIPGGIPYPISYRSLIPKRDECTNLIVPVCLSSSHIAYGSIRMEPVFMVLGQSASIAIKLARDKGIDLQDVDAKKIQEIMTADPYLGSAEPDIVIDDDSPLVSFDGQWKKTISRTGYGPSCLSCSEVGESSVEYKFPEGLSGTYDLYAYQQSNPALNNLYEYSIDDGNKISRTIFDVSEMRVQGQTSGEWLKIGTYSFSSGSEASMRVKVNVSEHGKKAVSDAIMLIKR